MSPLEKNVAVKMLREHLRDIPRFGLPDGYSLRGYQPGDEETWLKIQLGADRHNRITPELFEEQFGSARASLPQRQCYLLDTRGREVGTATAWFDDHFEGARVGRLHWVAMAPEYQSRGLGKPLLTAVCHRLRELRHERVYLSTSSARLPAINLYLRFGFVPLIRSEHESFLWQRILDQTESFPTPGVGLGRGARKPL